MLNNEFIRSEMLAEEYINRVGAIRKLLVQGKTAECLSLINQLEESMLVTLATGELYDDGDIKTIN